MTAARTATYPAVRDLRRARRRRRVATLDWVDVLYRAYVTALLVAGALVGLVLATGGKPVSHGTVSDVRRYGPAWIGLVVAVAVGLGLRSGSRGGPLALEPADVTHVLLGPVDRARVLRGDALRQARGVALIGLLVGGTAGGLASRRLPGSLAAWLATGVLVGLVLAFATWGAALLASGLRVRSAVATAVGVVLVGWSVADVVARVTTSPASLVGEVALWPVHFRVVAVIGVLVAVALPVAGLLLVAGVSLEAMERRSGLVGQLRFAATVQDVRTIVVLHRQLAQEHARSDPWARLRARQAPGHACWRRGWAGIFRWPAARVTRLIVLVAAAGAAAALAGAGTVPMVAVAGIATFLAGLDAAEALAQEADHPDIVAGMPVDRGDIMVRHVAVPIAVMLIASLAGVAAAGLVTPSSHVVAVAAITAVPAATACVLGAAVAVVLGARRFGVLDMMFPEFAGIGLVLRTATPPAIAIAGFIPAVAAGQAAHGTDPAIAAAATLPVVAAVVLAAAGFVVWWARNRL